MADTGHLATPAGSLPGDGQSVTVVPVPGVYDVLVSLGAGTSDSDYSQWTNFWNGDGTEYRFCGLLGFGGKFWRANGRWYVNCYSEHETPERLALIAIADKQLARLKDAFDAFS